MTAEAALALALVHVAEAKSAVARAYQRELETRTVPIIRVDR